MLLGKTKNQLLISTEVWEEIRICTSAFVVLDIPLIHFWSKKRFENQKMLVSDALVISVLYFLVNTAVLRILLTVFGLFLLRPIVNPWPEPEKKQKTSVFGAAFWSNKILKESFCNAIMKESEQNSSVYSEL